VQQVYLDTTVPSAYVDPRAPERQRLTQEFWQERLPSYEGVISVLVLAEIHETPDAEKRTQLGSLVRTLTVLPSSPEAEALADEYVGRGVFPARFRGDALHVAIAVAHAVPLLASWNFRHLVRLQVRRQINLVNALLGYGLSKSSAHRSCKRCWTFDPSRMQNARHCGTRPATSFLAMR
jgi:hypothetical protein